MQNKIDKRWKHSIVFRTTLLLTYIGVIMGLVLITINLQLSSKHEAEKASKNLNRLLDIVEDTASIACFTGDQTLAKEVIHGLLKSPEVFSASLRDDKHELAHEQRASDASTIANQAESERVVLILRSPFDKSQKIGELSITPNLDEINRHVKHDVTSYGLMLLLQITGISAAIFVTLLFWFVRPIKSISDRLHNMSATEGHKIDVPKGHAQTEVGRLVYDINELTEHVFGSLQTIEKSNKQIMEGISYAKIIQSAIMPSFETTHKLLGNHFIIYEPKDMVGGDIYAIEKVHRGFMLAVIDCTGHGVPGAFMTMIAMTAIKQILSHGHCHGPSDLLKKLNQHLKLALYQHNESAMDDGLEIGVCWFDVSKKQMRFAGSKFPLLICSENNITILKSDKYRIGYKDADANIEFNEQSIDYKDNYKFYLYSDGLVDQVGHNGFPFGRKRLHELIQHNQHLDFLKQREMILNTLREYQGEQKQRDDITIVGWAAPNFIHWERRRDSNHTSEYLGEYI